MRPSGDPHDGSDRRHAARCGVGRALEAALRPQGLVLRRGDLVDLDELTANLVAAVYERAYQVTERGQLARARRIANPDLAQRIQRDL